MFYHIQCDKQPKYVEKLWDSYTTASVVHYPTQEEHVDLEEAGMVGQGNEEVDEQAFDNRMERLGEKVEGHSFVEEED